VQPQGCGNVVYPDYRGDTWDIWDYDSQASVFSPSLWKRLSSTLRPSHLNLTELSVRAEFVGRSCWPTWCKTARIRWETCSGEIGYSRYCLCKATGLTPGDGLLLCIFPSKQHSWHPAAAEHLSMGSGYAGQLVSLGRFFAIITTKCFSDKTLFHDSCLLELCMCHLLRIDQNVPDFGGLVPDLGLMYFLCLLFLTFTLGW
jgi:hypothetical protein